MPTSATNPISPQFSRLLDTMHTRAAAAQVFGDIAITADPRFGTLLKAHAKSSAEPAEYRVFADSGTLYVGLVTPARWLSQSIEADLVHTGDKLEDLIEEELIDQGLTGYRPNVEHFRDPDKLFTFRSPLSISMTTCDTPESIDRATRVLLAYEAAFRPLGDMDTDQE